MKTINQLSTYYLLLLTGSLLVSGLVINCKQKTPEPLAPIASFHLTANNCMAPCDPGIVNLAQNGLSFRWDFGDSGSSTDEMPKHTYTKAGNYLLKLTVMGEQNLIADTTAMVTIKNPVPVPTFLIQNDNCIAPCTVGLVNQSTNATTYSWRILTSYVPSKTGQVCVNGNNCPVYRTTSDLNTTQTYSGPAPVQGVLGSTRLPYTVELTATGPGGTQTISKNITIR